MARGPRSKNTPWGKLGLTRDVWRKTPAGKASYWSYRKKHAQTGRVVKREAGKGHRGDIVSGSNTSRSKGPDLEALARRVEEMPPESLVNVTVTGDMGNGTESRTTQMSREALLDALRSGADAEEIASDISGEDEQSSYNWDEVYQISVARVG